MVEVTLGHLGSVLDTDDPPNVVYQGSIPCEPAFCIP